MGTTIWYAPTLSLDYRARVSGLPNVAQFNNCGAGSERMWRTKAISLTTTYEEK